MRFALGGRIYLVILLPGFGISSPYYFKFGDKAYPLHYSSPSGLNVSGGNLEELDSTAESSAIDDGDIAKNPVVQEATAPKQVPDAKQDDNSTPTAKLIQQARLSSKEDAKAFRPSALVSMKEAGENIPSETREKVLAPTLKNTDGIKDTSSIIKNVVSEKLPSFSKALSEEATPTTHVQETPFVPENPPTVQESAFRPSVLINMQEGEPLSEKAPPIVRESVVRPTYDSDTVQDTLAAAGGSIGVSESMNQDDTFTPSFLRKGWQRGRIFGSNLKTQMNGIKRPKLSFSLPKQESIKEGSSRFFTAVAPATLAIGELFYRPDKVPITLPAIIALTLLGSSVGFYLFLYFITVGYACGIALPLLAAALAYNKQMGSVIPTLTNIHSGLVIAWGIRAMTFFLYREFFNWPELHEKVVEVNRAARLNAKLFCWIVFSTFYVCMITPCLLRLKTQKTWGAFGVAAIALQLTSLLVETVADFQKSAFKAAPGNRNRWCNVGIWRFSTHPNYLGEIMFWVGTFLGGVSCFSSPIHWIASIIGLLFIVVVLRGAISSLGAKHLRKYGNDVEFLEFRRTHSVLGPFHFSPQPQQSLSL